MITLLRTIDTLKRHLTTASAEPKPEYFFVNIRAQRVTQKHGGFGFRLQAFVSHAFAFLQIFGLYTPYLD